MSYYKKAGYKAKCNGDEYDTEFRVLVNYKGEAGEIVRLARDDGSRAPYFNTCDGRCCYAMYLPGAAQEFYAREELEVIEDDGGQVINPEYFGATPNSWFDDLSEENKLKLKTIAEIIWSEK